MGWNWKNVKDKDSDSEEIKRLAKIQALSPVHPDLENLDPNPNIHQLFQIFDKQFFWGKLIAVEVKWSPRMTQCAGICRYHTSSGFCTIGLSKPLLSLRPRKDLVETLLHEMIHAFLFVTHNNRDRDGHGPQFKAHMGRINSQIGSNISIYHTFHDEVRAQKVHVWRCEGPCKDRPPFYGYVRRSMNRAPGPHDLWHPEHRATCGGTFVKILEPPGFKSKKKGAKSINGTAEKENDVPTISSTPKITTIFPKASPESTAATFIPFSGTGTKLGSGDKSQTNRPVAVGVLKRKKSFDSPTKRHPGQKDISSFFNNTSTDSPSPFSASPINISSSPTTQETRNPLKRRKSADSPQTDHRDISSYFNRKDLDISSDDSELLILSPPSKRPRSGSPYKDDRTIPCPICCRSGFTDINRHANECLSYEGHEPCSSKDSDRLIQEVKTSSSKVVDDSVQEILPHSSKTPPTNSSNKKRTKSCPICGKLIESNILNQHLTACIASIPDDFDDEILITKETKPVKTDEKLKCLSTSISEFIDTVNCPICGKSFLQGNINSHLDDCLVSSQFQ